MPTLAPTISLMWGERPIALAGDVLRRRIYAPAAYAQARDSAVVPVVHTEAYQLAAWFPLVWRRRGGEYDLVAVRALINDQRAQPAVARGLLPRILHAYPFVFAPGPPPGPDSVRMFDDVFADHPTDAGASITTASGRLARATVLRFRMLDELAREFPVTYRIGQELAARNLFTSWRLKFHIEGHEVELPDLFIVRPEVFETGALAALLQQLGPAAALILGLHRVSIFRAGALLASARQLLKLLSVNPADDQAHYVA
jgi:SapC protein